MEGWLWPVNRPDLNYDGLLSRQWSFADASISYKLFHRSTTHSLTHSLTHLLTIYLCELLFITPPQSTLLQYPPPHSYWSLTVTRVNNDCHTCESANVYDKNNITSHTPSQSFLTPSLTHTIYNWSSKVIWQWHWQWQWHEVLLGKMVYCTWRV
jgi:hypothetical protein